MTLSIAFFVVFLFYLLEIVREIVDEWDVMVGTRGQWIVLVFTVFLVVWVTDPWGGAYDLRGNIDADDADVADERGYKIVLVVGWDGMRLGVRLDDGPQNTQKRADLRGDDGPRISQMGTDLRGYETCVGI